MAPYLGGSAYEPTLQRTGYRDCWRKLPMSRTDHYKNLQSSILKLGSPDLRRWIACYSTPGDSEALD